MLELGTSDIVAGDDRNSGVDYIASGVGSGDDKESVTEYGAADGGDYAGCIEGINSIICLADDGNSGGGKKDINDIIGLRNGGDPPQVQQQIHRSPTTNPSQSFYLHDVLTIPNGCTDWRCACPEC